MNIVVCVKQVPDTGSERTLKAADSTLDREASDALINELDEYAIEEGLRLAEANGGEVTILSMGPPRAERVDPQGTVHGRGQGRAPGGRRARRVGRPGHLGGDRRGARPRSGSTWSSSDQSRPTPGWACSRRCCPSASGVPQLSFASKVEIDGQAITINRQADYGYDKVEASLPAVLSVVEKINEPRYPSFKGIMAAKKKPVETLSLADAGIDPASVGLAASATEVVSLARRPPRQAGTIVKDEGDGGVKAAEFLAAQKFI